MKLIAGLFGLHNFYDGDINSYIEIAQAAEEMGFHGVSLTDHVVMGKNLHKYPFGSFPLPSEAPWYEPLTVLTMIASHTKTLHLGTAVLIVPLRNPALLAKTAATIDMISKGRLELGVGMGWQAEEYHVAGVPFENRAEIFWETLEICKLLWAESPASHDGNVYQFEDIWCQPQPMQGADLPLLFGLKMTTKNAEKIAQIGHGWIPIKTDAEFISTGKVLLDQAFKEHNRNEAPRIRGQLPTQIDSSGVPSLDLTLKELENSIAAGLTEVEIFPINFVRSKEDIVPVLQAISEIKG
ncbi:TIGR03619 family F420-dependent LLM class oxidoreductase [Gammaproteobacteria bacterium]|jgi:probable F420-dependent oxidoreductase|nr:TIGR03619 family F420-dependent LLM class oxidoreductase [Gammaproteobacteria bacterium]MDB9769388.1 TIGR03619 family F420-dependent LLM class oxidoreductase [Gammaproteobacteria bacterium]MDB9934122.1 TIGR03619 family F420-dependent LLM class oxidoreductase [Gammaproteobacteria bacterium]MDB9939961.1 TIGR03619 family F420-dependent LLM class oxidoreductase [Gammaproteobacteria bacterium]MDC0129979.1 TIGR03619 family F420-dependent LLM class oxidoreductase [Gammaproteobacteria bacterium]|tara:strand:- start:2022 stop:2909 length:888 start_codon:yes stop_codon:yes gene_type:complete